MNEEQKVTVRSVGYGEAVCTIIENLIEEYGGFSEEQVETVMEVLAAHRLTLAGMVEEVEETPETGKVQ